MLRAFDGVPHPCGSQGAGFDFNSNFLALHSTRHFPPFYEVLAISIGRVRQHVSARQLFASPLLTGGLFLPHPRH